MIVSYALVFILIVASLMGFNFYAMYPDLSGALFFILIFLLLGITLDSRVSLGLIILSLVLATYKGFSIPEKFLVTMIGIVGVITLPLFLGMIANKRAKRKNLSHIQLSFIVSLIIGLFLVLVMFFGLWVS
jgi:hypothetical protein